MKGLTDFLASFLMGLLPVGLVALALMLYKGMFLETVIVSTVSTLIGALIMSKQ